MLLQNLHVHLSETELLIVIKYLDSVTRQQKNECSPTSSPQRRLHRRLTRNLSNDHLISPVPLSEFPQICTFQPKQFPPHLRPHRTPGSVSSLPPPSFTLSSYNLHPLLPTLFLSPSLLPSLPPSLTPSLPASLTPSLPSLSLPHSLPPCLTHSLPPSLSLTPLPHSLPHSLPPSFSLTPLPPTLPHTLLSLQYTCKGPFIVSQLVHGKKERRPEILWVVHDSGEISMDITNPLEFELRVENMVIFLILSSWITKSHSTSVH